MLKIIGWTILSVVVFLFALILAIRTSFVQNKLTHHAISFLQNRIKTEVRLEYIHLSFPKSVVLKGLYLEDQSGDTLLYANELVIDTDLWGLLHQEVQLDEVALDKVVVSVNRSAKDGAFNFNYIIDSFSGKDSVTTQDTASQSWKFKIDDVEISNARLFYYDSLDGNFIDGTIGNLEVEMDEFDPDLSVYYADAIRLKKVKATVLQTKKNEQPTNDIDSIKSDHSLDLRFGEINLNEVAVNYTQQYYGQVVAINLGEANVETHQMDLRHKKIDLNKLTVANTFASYHQMDHGVPSAKVEDVENTHNSFPFPWKISLEDLNLSGLSLQYYDFRKSIVTSGIDFNHLWISGFDLVASDFELNETDAKIELDKLTLREKSGFAITSAQADISFTSTTFSLSNFKIATPVSKIAIELNAGFRSFNDISKHYDAIPVQLDIKDSELSLSDWLYFQPHFSDSIPIKLRKNLMITVDAGASGKLNDLRVDHFNFQVLDSTRISCKGNIKGLPDFNRSVMKIHLDELYTIRKDMESILPDSLLLPNIEIPRWASLSGDFNGTIKQPTVSIVLNSSEGAIALNAKANLDSSIETENYRGEIAIKNFQLGNVLRNNAIGKLDMKASVNGAGLQLDQLDAKVNIKVNHVEYNHYNYKDLIINGFIKKFLFSGNASFHDKNLDFEMNANLNYNETVPQYKLEFELMNADLQALRLAERPLKARGTLDIDMATSDFKIMNGNVAIRKFGIYNGKELYMVDSLLVASVDQEGESKITIRSDVIDGDFKGTINLYSLPQVVRNHFNNYFSLNESVNKKINAAQDFKFNLTLKDTDLLTKVLLPDLQPFVPGEISGEFDSEEHRLDLRFGISKVKYGGISVDSIRFNVLSDAKQLNYSFSTRNFAADTLRIAGLRFTGKVANDSILTKLTILDSVRDEKYIIGGVINSYKEAYRFRLLTDELMLNYEKWNTPGDNYLMIARSGLQPHHFEISKEEQKISLLKKMGADSAVSLAFQHIELKDLTSLVEGITPVTGTADGDFTVSVAERGAFGSRLRINSLTVLNQAWGNLSVTVNKKPSTPYLMNLEIAGEHVDMTVKGNYGKVNDVANIDLKAELSKLRLEEIQPLTLGIMKRMEGIMSGEVEIKGALSKPAVNGKLHFSKASFVPAAVNSNFKLNDETIEINESGFKFSKLKILDERNNVASIDGDIITKDLTTFALNLDVKADNFQLLNSTMDDNDLFYGKVDVTTRMKIRGTSDQPKVTMEVSLGDKSNFNFVVPQSEKGIQDQKGIVTFVDKDAAKDPFLASIQPGSTASSHSFKGIDISANIDLTDGETFNIIIDPATGDKLSVKGNAALTFNMNSSGEMTLSGRYEITSGSYDFSFYKLVKRNFLIEKGSTITWYGDPMEAQMDIKALYKVETSPMELVSNQIDMTNPQEVNMYKQRIPFLVYLMIQGELLAPQISFNLDMPVEKQNVFGGNVYATIQDINTRESDLNKQVFALLVLKRFIAENPFDSQGGGDLGSSARTSVSQILTEQLNRLSQNIKGVQLSFDLKSYDDYSTGTAQGQTQFQLGLSKTLFNDRLVVKVSGNLDIEGQDASEQHSAADYIGDLALEYKITSDGRFRITGFRNGNYDMIDGELTETGAGLIYIKDYNAFKELFKANENENP